jgi:hypothetical protein
MYYTKFLATSVVVLLASFSNAQTDSTSSMKVYLNCQWCYQDYLRTQITWVNFVQDQFVSDVDLMVTGLATGGGGTEYQLVFSGKKGMAGMNDTIKFTVNAIQTDNEQREILARKVKLGLVRYASCTATGDCLIIDSNSKQDSLDVGIGSNPQEDPWNAWVFRVGLNGSVSAQKVYQSGYFRGNISATQVKETHKLSINTSANYNEQRYNYSGLKQNYILRSQYMNVYYVHSINDHWSAGAFSYTERSDFSNYDLMQNVSAAVEYDFFPYQDAQTRMITLAYRVGFNYYDFQEETIYNKMIDRIPTQSLNFSAQITQDWGQFSCGMEGACFLNDFDKNHLLCWSNFDVRIFKGLSANAYLNYNIKRDQVNIRLNGASQEEVLLQQQELLTNFDMGAYFGISYRFGSIYNNVVNPRFNY